MIVHRKVRSLRNAAAFDSWLYRIVMRESAHVRRRRPIPPQLLYEGVFGSDSATTLDVRSALAELPPDLRDVTVLFYFDDLKTQEIAGILGVAHVTVRTRLLRARERLRDILGDYRDERPSETREVEQHEF